jgi:hypothetical protein
MVAASTSSLLPGEFNTQNQLQFEGTHTSRLLQLTEPGSHEEAAGGGGVKGGVTIEHTKPKPVKPWNIYTLNPYIHPKPLTYIHPKPLYIHPKTLTYIHPKPLYIHPKPLYIHPKPLTCAREFRSLSTSAAPESAAILA